MGAMKFRQGRSVRVGIGRTVRPKYWRGIPVDRNQASRRSGNGHLGSWLSRLFGRRG